MKDAQELVDKLAAEHPELILSAAARIRSAMRTTRAGGKAPIYRPCPFCGQKFAAREMRLHIPACRAASRNKSTPLSA